MATKSYVQAVKDHSDNWRNALEYDFDDPASIGRASYAAKEHADHPEVHDKIRMEMCTQYGRIFQE